MPVTLPTWTNGLVVAKSHMDVVNAAILATEVKADNAQSTATSAAAAAATAQTTANTGVTNAATALGVGQQASRWSTGSTTPAAKHVVTLRRSAVQSIPSGADTPIVWQAVAGEANVGAMWSSSTNPERVTIQRAGIYIISCRVAWASNATNRRAVHLSVGGLGVGFFKAGDARVSTIANDEAAWPMFTKAMLLAVGDVLRFEVWQNTGGNLDVEHANLGGTWASIVYEGPIV